MFTIKTNYADSFEINAPLEKVKDFFSQTENYASYMPNLESIRTDNRGVTRWTILAEVPFIGKMRQSFAVDFFSNGDFFEWLPSPVETQNYLRIVAEVTEKAADKVLVRYTQNVEIRRDKANQLHPMAGLASESAISKGMQAEVEKMLKTFTNKVKEKLEKV